MVIISESHNTGVYGYRSSQFRYAMTYVVITLLLLYLLNVFSSAISQQLVFENKEHSLVDKCQLASDEISSLQVLNASTVSGIVSQMESLRITRLIVTDQAGTALYDSADEALGFNILLPEVLEALDGNDVFCGSYRSGEVFCRAATPIFYYGTIIGSVYMTECDTEQGKLLHTLQRNIFQLTLVLEAAVVLFSLLYSFSFSMRIDKIMNSMRIIQSGDYSHKVEIRGNDELTVLGQEVNDLTERLSTSEGKRRQFVSDASHEIKTPLASIKLLSDSILQNEMDPDTLREFVGDIGHEAERLNRMTAKLLSLTKVDSGIHQETEIIHMIPTIQRVSRMLQPTAQAASVKIQLELLEECPVLMLEDDLYQIVFNLMENGIKYNLPNGTLTVRLQKIEDNAVLTISDTGVGIPEDSIGLIFDRFYRVDKARSRASGGSGLGLAIVHTLVESNRGTIQAESTLGKGSCFTVTFPLFDTEAAQ